MNRSLLRAATSLAAASLLLAACDDSPGGDPEVEQDPEGALEEAVDAASEWSGVQAVFTADGDWEALAEADGAELPEGLEEDLDDASATLSVTFEPPYGVAFDTELDGDLLIGLRFQEDTDLLLTVDLGAIRDMLDDQGERELDQALGMAGMFGFSDVVRAFDDGEWVAFLLPDDASDEIAVESEIDEAREDLLEALRTDGVEVTYVEADEVGDRLSVTVDPAQVAEAMGEPPPADDEPVVVDVWIADGQLTQLAIDISEVDDDLDQPMVLTIDLEEFEGPIDVPEADTTFDVEEALGGFFGGFDMDMDDLG